jgi:hypothetical protein
LLSNPLVSRVRGKVRRVQIRVLRKSHPIESNFKQNPVLLVITHPAVADSQLIDPA